MAVLRLMVWISLKLGRRVSRIVLHGIATYFVLFAPAARKASRQFLARALGRPAGWADVYRHVLAFASTVHDRVYFLNGREDLFDIEVVGEPALREALAQQNGLLLMGAHLGSFEALRTLGRGKAELPVAMMMYADNARKINAALEAINPAATQDIIPLGSTESMLMASEKLSQGYLVGMLADRRLGDDDVTLLPFLGEPAAFPTGPFRVSAVLRRPVFFMTGLYLGGNRYRLHFEPLADFSAADRATRRQLMEQAQQDYVRRLEHFCREAPLNWFNFFDFWHRP